jgi:hypothetical protein
MFSAALVADARAYFEQHLDRPVSDDEARNFWGISWIFSPLSTVANRIVEEPPTARKTKQPQVIHISNFAG